MLAAIEAAASRRPSLVFVATAHENPDTTLSYVDRLISQDVDGIIIASPLIDPETDFPENGPPIVYIDSPGSPGISIEFDLERYNTWQLATLSSTDTRPSGTSPHLSD